MLIPTVRMVRFGLRTRAVFHEGLQHSLHDLNHCVQRVGFDTAAPIPYSSVRDWIGVRLDSSGYPGVNRIALRCVACETATVVA